MAGHGLGGVAQQIQGDLFDFGLVALHAAQRRIVIPLDYYLLEIVFLLQVVIACRQANGFIQ